MTTQRTEELAWPAAMARKDRIIERLEREITVLNKIASDGSEACARIAASQASDRGWVMNKLVKAAHWIARHFEAGSEPDLGKRLDYWPTRNKWQYNGRIMTGNVKAFIEKRQGAEV